MIFASNSLINPAIGTLFWTVLTFTLFFLILKKYAWKPILNAVKQRDEMIKGSLISAEKARAGIEREKTIALSSIREQIANLSVEIASKLIEKKLKQTGEQAKLIDTYLKDVDFNKN